MTLVAYAPAMRAGWIWDDDYYITGNAHVTHSGDFLKIWQPADARLGFLPLTESTFWVEWRLWGSHPAGYHVVNILLHALAAVLVWRVLGSLGVPGAFLAAVLFSLHPVTVASVAWVAERKNVLSMVLYLLTILVYLKHDRSRGPSWYVAALGLFLLALLSKASVVVLPPVLLLLAWWQRGRIGARDLLRAAPFFALALAAGLMEMWFQSHRAIGPEVVRPETWASRIAASGWIVWFYLGKILVPVHLSLIYPRWSVDGSSVVSFLPLALLVGCLVVLWVVRKGLGRGPLLALGYFVLTLLPVLAFVDMSFSRYSLVSDHLQYLSMVGIIALVAGLLAWLRPRVRVPVAAAALSMACVACVLGFLTWCQASTYRDEQTLWQATLRENDSAWVAHNNLGNALNRSGRTSEAIAHFREALRLKPDYLTAHDNLANALARSGQFPEAVEHYEEVLRLKSDYPEAHNNLANALARLGRIPEAIEEYQETLRLRPDYVEARCNLGVALAGSGKVAEAIEQYREALRFSADYPEAHAGLGNLLVSAGRIPEAVEHYREALRLRPDWPQVLNDLAWLFATQAEAKFRNGREAVRLAEGACALTKNSDAGMLDTLGAAYAEAGRLEDAVKVAKKALELSVAGRQGALTDEIRKHLKLYEVGRPWHEPPRP